MLLPIGRESQRALEKIHNLSFENYDDSCHANKHDEAKVSHWNLRYHRFSGTDFVHPWTGSYEDIILSQLRILSK